MSDLTPRAYLVSLGLAKEGRGRFSADAVKALDEAKAKGMTFAEPAKPVAKAKTPKAPKPAKAENGADKAEKALARRNAKAAETKAEAADKAQRAPSPLDMPKRRPENSGYIVENGTLFRFDRCGTPSCRQPVTRCNCKGGPKAPTYRGTGIQGQVLTLDKPASL